MLWNKALSKYTISDFRWRDFIFNVPLCFFKNHWNVLKAYHEKGFQPNSSNLVPVSQRIIYVDKMHNIGNFWNVPQCSGWNRIIHYTIPEFYCLILLLMRTRLRVDSHQWQIVEEKEWLMSFWWCDIPSGRYLEVMSCYCHDINMILWDLDKLWKNLRLKPVTWHHFRIFAGIDIVPVAQMPFFKISFTCWEARNF